MGIWSWIKRGKKEQEREVQQQPQHPEQSRYDYGSSYGNGELHDGPPWHEERPTRANYRYGYGTEYDQGQEIPHTYRDQRHDQQEQQLQQMRREALDRLYNPMVNSAQTVEPQSLDEPQYTPHEKYEPENDAEWDRRPYDSEQEHEEEETEFVGSYSAMQRSRDDVTSAYGGYSSDDIEADRLGTAETSTKGAKKKSATTKAKVDPNSVEARLRLFLSGDILLKKSVAKFFPHAVILGVASFISVAALFWSLYIDLEYKELQDEVQKLHEHSLRMQQKRVRVSSYSAVEKEVQRRKMGLQRAEKPSQVIQ